MDQRKKNNMVSHEIRKMLYNDAKNLKRISFMMILN